MKVFEVCLLAVISINGGLLALICIIHKLDGSTKLLWLLEPSNQNSDSQLFGPFGANPTLTPEESKSFEVGTTAYLGMLTVEAVYFLSHFLFIKSFTNGICKRIMRRIMTRKKTGFGGG